MTNKIEFRPVRRVVTGENNEGRSIIASDGPAPNVVIVEQAPLVAQVVWATGPGSAEGDDPAPAGHDFHTHTGSGGSLVRIADFPPDELVNQEVIRAMIEQHGMARDGRHFWFHQTKSLDYAICLEGEMCAMMDVGETTLYPGDVLIQRGTSHSWSNRSGKWCRMAFVLLT